MPLQPIIMEQFEGYDIWARITLIERDDDPRRKEILVLNNNSTHFIVEEVTFKDDTDKPFVRRMGAYAYGAVAWSKANDAVTAYRAALSHATALAHLSAGPSY